ncbi:MAG: transposase [Rhodospirillales bacterium]|nr:transposase [Rhodospirillales bacterium]
MLILDNAGWHTTGKLDVPANTTLVFLPPASPELNPAENIWQYLRRPTSRTASSRTTTISSGLLSGVRKLTAEAGRIRTIATGPGPPSVRTREGWYNTLRRRYHRCRRRRCGSGCD